MNSFSKVGIYSGSVGSFYKIEQLVNFFPNDLKSKIAIIIIGDGDKYDSIKKSISKKGLTNFFILPSKNHQELKKYFKIADFAFGFHPDYDELYKYGLCPLKRMIICFINFQFYLLVKNLIWT